MDVLAVAVEATPSAARVFLAVVGVAVLAMGLLLVFKTQAVFAAVRKIPRRDGGPQAMKPAHLRIVGIHGVLLGAIAIASAVFMS